MVTDVHAHVIVPEILRDACPDEEWRPLVRWEDDGTQLVEMAGRGVRSMVEEAVDVDGILAAQDEAGVQRVVLSPFVPLLYYDAEPEEGLRRCRIQNQALARTVREHPERVAALGAVPLQEPELAATELRALMAEGALSGVEIAASVRGVYLGDDRFEPFWAAAAASRALVFVHPTTRGFGDAVFDEYYLWNAVGNPTETTVAAAHMVLAGVLERHPTLHVVLAHGGGALLALRGRLRHAYEQRTGAHARLSEPPERSIKRFYFDTVVHDHGLLRALVDYAGPEHVLLGSDYPFDMGDLRPADSVRACGFNPDVEAAILGGNAEHLIATADVTREEMIR
jgi:aminocarboxymuconate-semialdehyde decarboxylase